MTYKTFSLSEDILTSDSAINEILIASGGVLWNSSSDGNKNWGNVKQFQHFTASNNGWEGYFQTVYSGHATASNSSAIFDVSFGLSTGSSLVTGPDASLYCESYWDKTRQYKNYAKLLLGNHDSLFQIGDANAVAHEVLFVHYKRNMFKDEIKRGNCEFLISHTGSASGSDSSGGSLERCVTIKDNQAISNYSEGVSGEYADLKINNAKKVGQIWYQAGVAALSCRQIFSSSVGSPLYYTASFSGSATMFDVIMSGTTDAIMESFRDKMLRLTLHNQVNTKSNIYSLPISLKEFTYSSNPTFVDSDGRIIVTSGSNTQKSQTYITTAGLYSPNNELLAVAKLSEPVKNDPESSMAIRVRLDY